MVIILNALEDLKAFINKSDSKLVVLYFFASWCKPCQEIDLIWENLENRYGSILVVKVNVEIFDQIAIEYRICTIPTFSLIKKQRIISRFCGIDKKVLRSNVKKFV